MMVLGLAHTCVINAMLLSLFELIVAYCLSVTLSGPTSCWPSTRKLTGSVAAHTPLRGRVETCTACLYI